MKRIHIFLLFVVCCTACAVKLEEQRKSTLNTDDNTYSALADSTATLKADSIFLAKNTLVNFADTVSNSSQQKALSSDSLGVTKDTLSNFADTVLVNAIQKNILSSDSLILSADSLSLKGELVSGTETFSGTNTATIQTDSLSADTTKNEYINARVDYQAADSIVVSLNSEKMRMYNKAQVHYQQQKIDAHYIDVDVPKNLVYAKYGLDTAGVEIGYPVFKDKQSEYEVGEMYYNIKSEKGLVKDILTQEGEGYVRGGVAKKVDENTFYLKDGRYTTCDHHDHPHYFIKMRKSKTIKNDKIVTGWANLVIEDVELPIGLPFGIFPLKKRYSSGIIIPSFGEEKVRGFYFRDFGYYWAVNDFFDARFNGSIFTNGSWETTVSTNYKKRYRYNGRFNFSYAINKFGDKGLDDYRRAKDFAIRWTHTQDSKAHPYRTLSASVNISTSENDYRNARSINNIVNTTKQSSVSYSRRWPDSPFSLSVALQHSQNKRDTTISLTLPNVNFSMQTQYPFRPKDRVGELKWYDMISVGYNAQMTNSIRTHEDKLFKSSLRRDWRNGFQHRIPISTSYKLAKDLTFSANLDYRGVAYLNSIRKSYDAIKDKVLTDTINGFYYAQNFTTSASVSFTPKIFGMYTFNKTSKIQAIRHVMSPSVSFSYTPDFGLNDDKYYRTYDDRVSDKEVRYNILSSGVYGLPQRGSKSGFVSLSLDNNIEMKVRNNDDSTSNEEFKKIKLLESFRISTSYNVFADSMNLSNISLSGRTSLFKNKVNIQMNGSIDPYALDENKKGRINKFAGGLGRLISAGFSLGTSFTGGKSDGSKKDKDNQNDGIDNDIKGGDNVFGDRKDVEAFNDINEYVDFKIPWSVRIDYNFRYTKPQDKVTTSQYLRLTGDLSLTEKWKVSLNTGYDFGNKEVTTTSFSIFRDLHCWEMSFSAIPFGRRQSFNFRIAVKSTLLKDLKLEKKDSWYDNF